MPFPRRPKYAALPSLVLALTLGCSESDEPREVDPWGSAGVTAPEITETTTDGRTMVEVKAATSLPLEDRDNQTGFNRRVSKIAWRTHLGRIDELNVTAGEEGHPERSYAHAWKRAELEEAFGRRLAGLDAGEKTSLRQNLPARDGAFSDRGADRVDDGAAILREVLRATARDSLGTSPRLEEAEPQECLGGLTGKDPTGDFKTSAEAESPLHKGTHPAGHLTKVAAQWSELGLGVDMSGLFTGTEDRIAGELPGVGRVIMSEHPQRAHGKPGYDILQLAYVTDCLKP